MKLTTILTIAVTMLCAVHSSALAEEPAKPSGEFREISPEEMEARLAGQWWRQAGEIETPAGASTEGTWLIRLEMFDESGKLLSQSELLSKSNSFASSKTKLVAGQQGVGDFTTLDDYCMLMWAFPPQYEQAFRDYGHLDWPANRDGVKVTREDGTELDLSQPQLSKEQCRELFTQMLRRAAVLEYDGLRLYMFSPVASSINLHLDWTDRADEPEALPRDPREREAVIREKARPAADFTLYLNGGQWAGGDSMQAGGEWSSGGTIAGGQFAGGGDVAGTDTDGGEWAGGGDSASSNGGQWVGGGNQFANAHLAVQLMQAEKRSDFKPSTSVANRSWWSSLDPPIRPDPYTSQGRWLLDFNLMDETGRVVSESSLQLIDGFPAQLSNVRGRGQDSDPDYGELEDYYLLAWVIPDELHADFLQSGYLDWPVPNSDRLVVGDDGQYIESSPPQLNDERKRALFTEAMSRAHHMLMEGLHFYVFSPQAASADFVLKWQDGMPGGNTLDVASCSVNFANGGQWAGVES